MYALIYDEHKLDQPLKKVISLHRTRSAAEDALERRQRKLHRRGWDCNTRIVWLEKRVKNGEFVRTADFETWRPGEYIPEGERYSDTD